MMFKVQELEKKKGICPDKDNEINVEEAVPVVIDLHPNVIDIGSRKLYCQNITAFRFCNIHPW